MRFLSQAFEKEAGRGEGPTVLLQVLEGKKEKEASIINAAQMYLTKLMYGREVRCFRLWTQTNERF
jgi:hypothetical protein